jgi:thiamine biosynthesis lipoprotein
MPKPSYFFEAIGTHFEIVTRVTLTEHVKEEIQQLIQQFDGYFSRFRVDSVAHKMAKEPGVYLLPKGSQRLFKLYESLYRLTRGKMTPLIGASLEASVQLYTQRSRYSTRV